MVERSMSGGRGLEDRVRAHVAARGGLSPETADCLAAAGTAFLEQIVSDLRETVTSDVIGPGNILKVSASRHWHAVSVRLEAFHADLLQKLKQGKVVRLRQAGYGATSDHVTFVQNMFDSQHEVLVPNLDIEASDGDTE
jgi:hypothetical protein